MTVHGATKVILLVEDDPRDETLALRAMQKCPIPAEVVVARDGVEALDYLFGTGVHAGRDRRDLPQLMLLDLKLPKIDGLEVLQRVRADAYTRFLPVVILTSSDEQRDIVESYRRGVNGYVRKPLDFGQFTEAIKHLGVYWLTLNIAPVP